ncbi:MAG TPA: S8 family peptidase [Streptosporangiaceae bacterium]|nr:S8 family peptidase [Streptosporangiaceae bacterium]
MWQNVLFGGNVGYRSWFGRLGKRRLTAMAAAVAALAATSLAGVPAASADSDETVIVTASGLLSPVTAVLQVGGSVLTQFHLIAGVVATIPAAVAPVLGALPGITVTPDASVTIQSVPESTGPHTPSDAFLAQTGANRLAASGDTGQGVTVAVLDTGIDQLPDFSGRLAGGADLTGEGNPFQDDYGHGTFVAGLIAGNGASSNGQYSGEAPGANLVSIKVAGASGQTDLGTVIEGLQWAVDHQGTYGIKVLNLSLGFQPTQSTLVDPLDQAVQAVWDAGITVVASAGNAGPFNGTILSPGDDPLVITVGALDDMASPSASGDEMTNFSSVGPTSPDGWAKPDLVTSGESVVSLAAPGSTIYDDYPSARIGAANLAGSGTSFATAITSGAAALVLADNPGLTPDQVKARLLGNTNPGPVGNPFVDGHGALNADAAATSGPMDLSQTGLVLPTLPGISVPLSPARPFDTWNTGLWSGLPPVETPSAGPAADGLNWNGAAWNGWVWNELAWDRRAWAGAYWNGSAWTGSAWDGTAWDGSPWSGAAWGSDLASKCWNGG